MQERRETNLRETMSGYLMLQRRFFSHWIWEESRSFSKAEAFLDLLQLAAFAPTKRMISGSLIELDEGEIVASVRYLSARWTWGKDKVAGFMKALEKDAMIRRETRQGETVIILCNYKDYNRRPDKKPDSDPDRQPTVARQRPDKEEEGKEGKESSSKADLSDFDDDDDLDDLQSVMPKDIAKRMTTIQKAINSLHPSWKKRPHFSAKELYALNDNAKGWIAVGEDDWKLLTAYMDAAIPDSWRKDPRDFFQPDNRLALISIGPTSILGIADKWLRKCKSAGIRTGLETKKSA